MALRKSADRVAVEAALEAAGAKGATHRELIKATGLAGARVSQIMREVLHSGMATRTGIKATDRYHLAVVLAKTGEGTERQVKAKGPKLMAITKDPEGRVYHQPFRPQPLPPTQVLASASYTPLTGYRLHDGLRPGCSDYRAHGSREGGTVKPYTGRLMTALDGVVRK